MELQDWSEANRGTGRMVLGNTEFNSSNPISKWAVRNMNLDLRKKVLGGLED